MHVTAEGIREKLNLLRLNLFYRIASWGRFHQRFRARFFARVFYIGQWDTDIQQNRVKLLNNEKNFSEVTTDSSKLSTLICLD